MSIRELQTRRASPVSRNRQIREAILDKILSGEWPAETRVPSENELVKHFGVSRMTVHHALRALQAEGYLVRAQGLGTFVARPRSHNTIIRLYNVAEEIQMRGGDYRLETVVQERRPPTSSEAALFRISKQTALYSLVILHLENDRPLQIERRLINPKAVPDLTDYKFEGLTPFEFLMKKYPYPDGRHVIRAVVADNEDANLLRLGVNAPCLEVERTTWIDDLVITHVKLRYPADRYEITGDISRSEMKLSTDVDYASSAAAQRSAFNIASIAHDKSLKSSGNEQGTKPSRRKA